MTITTPATPTTPATGGTAPAPATVPADVVHLVDEIRALPAPEGTVTRVRVLIGEDDDAVRRGDKQLVAWSDCRYYCPDVATVQRCIAALRESDERLRARPDELMLWDWQSTFFEADPANSAGGGTVILGVAWYDQEFYTDRRVAWFGAMHKRVYTAIGVPLENVTVTHWRRDD